MTDDNLYFKKMLKVIMHISKWPMKMSQNNKENTSQISDMANMMMEIWDNAWRDKNICSVIILSCLGIFYVICIDVKNVNHGKYIRNYTYGFVPCHSIVRIIQCNLLFSCIVRCINDNNIHYGPIKMHH